MSPLPQQDHPLPPADLSAYNNKRLYTLLIIAFIFLLVGYLITLVTPQSVHTPEINLQLTGSTTTSTTNQETSQNITKIPITGKWIAWSQIFNAQNSNCPIPKLQGGKIFLEQVNVQRYDGYTTVRVTQFPHADPATLVFQVADDNSWCFNDYVTPAFAKDKDHVYWYRPGYFGEGGDKKDDAYVPTVYNFKVDAYSYYNAKVVDADPTTFEVLSPQWARDKDHVYGIGDVKFLTVKEADPATFEALPHGWGKDKNMCINFGTIKYQRSMVSTALLSPI